MASVVRAAAPDGTVAVNDTVPVLPLVLPARGASATDIKALFTTPVVSTIDVLRRAFPWTAPAPSAPV